MSIIITSLIEQAYIEKKQNSLSLKDKYDIIVYHDKNCDDTQESIVNYFSLNGCKVKRLNVSKGICRNKESLKKYQDAINQNLL